ncbi:MAG: lipid asymmetry maintenance protein MlaB [Phenylobacterium sp.]|uniref:STAS domain-containing protein n=1 Tax=Phenylobacterium sp. TaxID=1871053 RepID=UPI00391A68DA
MQVEDSYTVSLQGALNLRDAPAIREQLLAAIGEHEAVDLDLSGVESIDVALVQVLLAARKSADANGRILRLAPSPPGEACGVIFARCGLASDLWNSQETQG